MRQARASIFALVWGEEGAEAPDSLTIWDLTQAFHCRPSHLDYEDWGDMMAAIDAGNVRSLAQRMRRGDKLTPEEHELAGEILSYEEIGSLTAGDAGFEEGLRERAADETDHEW